MTVWERILRPAVTEVGAYRPGVSGAEIKNRYGLQRVVRLNWNENLDGALPGVLEQTATELTASWAYPEESYGEFTEAVAHWTGVAPAQVLPGHGIQALTLARTRENACNPASTDLTREGYQQQILNGIKSQLLSVHAFLNLPWASWYAPQALRTDMGGLTLLSMFAASEMGGSAPVQILKPTGGEVVPGVGDALTVTPQAVQEAVAKLLNG